MPKKAKEEITKPVKVEQGIWLLPSGKYRARISRVDSTGKERQYAREGANISEARRYLKDLKSEFDKGGAPAMEASRLRFREVAEKYKEKRLIAPVYDDDQSDHRRKIAGLKSFKDAERNVDTLIEAFGQMYVKTIAHEDVEQFKLKRLAQPKMRGEKEIGKRTVASVNRELETMRAVMRYATRKGWITRSPFDTDTPLISKADERRRDRVLSFKEEKALLAACEMEDKQKRQRYLHLRPLLICALDTAMRRGEMFKLECRDVDLSSGVIRVRATNTKTQTAREIPIMTDRLREELEKIINKKPYDPNALVFGITDTVKKSFAAVCTKAKVTDFHLHDCRHTAITRWIASGMPSAEVQKYSGHTQTITFLRYLNPTEISHKRNTELLTAYMEANKPTETVTETSNELVN